MKLKDWAIKNGVSPQTAYHWYHEGKLPVKTMKLGPKTILVIEDEDTPPATKTAIYARVSTAKNREGLESQKARLLEWAVEQGLKVDEIHTEVASGLNDTRKVWNKLLADPTIKTIIVEHRDRATRYGFEQLQASLQAHGRRILVVDATEVEDDLVRDMTELLTSLCARLYGKRGAAAKARKAVEGLSDE